MYDDISLNLKLTIALQSDVILSNSMRSVHRFDKTKSKYILNLKGNASNHILSFVLSNR